jgi:hypothetical protein
MLRIRKNLASKLAQVRGRIPAGNDGEYQRSYLPAGNLVRSGTQTAIGSIVEYLQQQMPLFSASILTRFYSFPLQ